MEDKSPYYVTISYDSALRDELKEMCNKHGIRQKDFVEFALRFFQKSGLNPQDPEAFISQKMKASENRLIGFLKVQDKNELNHFNILFDQLQEQSSTIRTLTSALELMHQELQEYKELIRTSLNRR